MAMAKQTYDYTSLLNNFSQNMKSERIKKGFTQKNLASLVGVTKQTILNYENQKTIPTSSVMESIAVALDVPLEALIGDNVENQRRVKVFDRIEKMNTNPDYERLVKEEELLDAVHDLGNFNKEVKQGTITEDQLDELIGGKLNKTIEEKTQFVRTQKEIDIQKYTEELLDFYENYSNEVIYRFE